MHCQQLTLIRQRCQKEDVICAEIRQAPLFLDPQNSRVFVSEILKHIIQSLLETDGETQKQDKHRSTRLKISVLFAMGTWTGLNS